MALVTIITPSYNRAHTLPNLFNSLQSQKKDFMWLIVDDGSTDNTEQIVTKFKNDADFEIRYIKKQNGGKHTALNAGIKLINTSLAMIVDSDDKLLPDAIAEIQEVYDKYSIDENISVLTFLRCYSNGKPVVTMDRDEFKANYIDYRIKQDRPGDMAEVFLTKVLKKYPFPEFSGERFLSEDVVWIEIGKKYNSVFVNKAIYECEYLEGGLTANDKPMKFASPMGSMMRGKQLLSKECGLKANVKGAIIYNCYKTCIHTELPGLLSLSIREMIIVAIAKPLGKLFYIKMNK